MPEPEIIDFWCARLDEEAQLALRWPDDEREWQNVGKRRLTYQSGSYENVTAIDVTNKPMLWWERIYIKADSDGLTDHIVRHDPARVLREVEAKQRIMATFVTLDTHPNRLTYAHLQQQWVALRAVIAALILPYADHPDYNPDWTI